MIAMLLLKRFALLFALVLPSLILFAQTQISGVVTGEADKPLNGVTITVKGKSQSSTTTNAAGIFTVDAPADAVLVFSYVGYATREVKASEAKSVRLALNAERLDDIVVVGYGTRKRKDVSSSVGTVSGKDLRKTPVATIDQAMQGRIAGVQVSANDGNPGGSISIKVRGATTLNPNGSNDPLFVIDDVISPQGLQLVNPSDVESIDVLKDAAATAIYGIQGANGVVVVKTKRGRAGDKVRVTVDAYTGVQNLQKKLQVLNPQQHARIVNEFLLQAQSDRIAQGQTVGADLAINPAWGTEERILALPTSGTDWQDAIFRTGQFNDINVGIGGGAAKTTYFVSSGYRKEEGAIINSSFKRYTLRANVDHQAANWLKLGTNFSFSYSDQKMAGSTNDNRDGLLQAALWSPAIVPLRDANGQYGSTPISNQNYYGSFFNPVSIVTSRNPNNIGTGIYGNVYGELKLPSFPALTFTSRFGFGRYGGNYKNFNGRRVGSGGKNDGDNAIYQGDYSSINWNLDNYLSYNKGINGHSVDATLGYVAQFRSSQNSDFSQATFPSDAPNYRYIGLGLPSSLTAGARASELAYNSYFARLGYNFKERYYAQLSLRRDAASTFFKAANRYGTFPAASVKWRISKENFFEKVNFFNDLSLRASYGISGTPGSSNDPYTGYTLLRASNITYPWGSGQTGQPGVGPSVYGNENLEWEKNKQTDIGLDASFWNNRFSVTLDWYNRVTQQMITKNNIRSTFGEADAPTVNLTGDNLKNTGLELSVTYQKNRGEFQYGASINGSINENKVLNIGSVPFIEPPSSVALGGAQPTRTAIGHPISAFYGYVFDGIYQNAADVTKGPEVINGRPMPGDMRFKDLDGDGDVDTDDRTFIGQPTPKYTYGINLNASYKNFDISTLIQGVSGNKIYNYQYYENTLNTGQGGIGVNRLTDVLNRWTGEGSTNSFPRVVANDQSSTVGNGRFSDFWLQNGAFTRIKNVQIGYTLAPRVSQRVGIERLRLYVTGNNLFTFTEYKGFDPEVNINTSQTDIFRGNRDLQAGVDRGVYPQVRSFVFGASVTF